MKIKPSPFRARALVMAAFLLTITLIVPPADAAGGHRSHGGHHSSGHHHGGSHHGGHYSGGTHSGHFLFHFHSYGYYPYPYYSPYNYPYGRSYYRGYGAAAMGALDLDVRPGRTAVYEDGRYLGTVDDFDGFPSYLWLAAGNHELTFYLEGYRTLVRQYSIAPGRVARVEDFLERGDSVPPEDDLLPGAGRRRGPASRPRELGWLRLEVTPRDATVYMDGRFVGTGEELAATDLTVEPGDHVLEVVRPGYEAHARRFTVTSGGTDEQAIDLERP